ncbi:MAG: sarcosine oxidase subunit gamma [Alphaproteobacteria bacterium]
MSEVIDTPYNPLHGMDYSAGTGPQLRLRPSDDCARFSLRIAPADLVHATDAFTCPIPAKVGEMSSSAGRTALCLGPDEWLLLAPLSAQETIAAHFADIREKASHSLVDVGHRSHAIEVTGPAAAMLLNTGCPLDLDAMPVGRCTRTIIDKVEIILMKLDAEHYRLEVARSFAEYLWTFLTTAGREFNGQH